MKPPVGFGWQGTKLTANRSTQGLTSGLPRRLEHSLPKMPAWVNLFSLMHGKCNGNVHKVLVPVPDDHIRPPRQTCMNGILPQQQAKCRIVGIRREAADYIARIDVLQRQRLFLLLEVFCYSLLQKQPDIRSEDIARCISGRIAALGQVPAGTLSHDDKGVVLAVQPLLQRSQEAILAVENERNFRDEAEINNAVGQRRHRRDKPRIPAHQLDQPHSVPRPAGLLVGAVYRQTRSLHRRRKPKRLLDPGYVVVYRLGNPYDANLKVPLPYIPDDLLFAAERSISANGEQKAYSHHFESIDHIVHVLVAAGRRK